MERPLESSFDHWGGLPLAGVFGVESHQGLSALPGRTVEQSAGRRWEVTKYKYFVTVDKYTYFRFVHFFSYYF